MTTDVKKETPATPGRAVTSTQTLDFPSLNWAIEAGEERELPVDAAAQEAILSNHYISLKTK